MRNESIMGKSQPTNLRNQFINIFVEQISHHPPISSFLIEHPNKDYVIQGNFEEEFTRNKSNLEFRILGETYIQFSDGDYYSIQWPAKILENSVYMKYEEYIRIEQLNGSNLTSTVFLGDSIEGDPLPIDGVIYYRDPEIDFNPKTKSSEAINDMEEIS
mmetsp:Transcript_23162/g.25713  ORF Transcript_23162/g.25713 Transcript_23162/m.25713 type:complete len:159 (+) Transcript_23162:857-1333(+)